MKISIYQNVSMIKDIWDSLYENSDSPSTMSYEMIRLFQRVYYNYFRKFRYRHRFVVAENGESMAVLPLSVDYLNKTIEEYYCVSTVPYFDILTNDTSQDFISDVISAIRREYCGYSFHISKLRKDGILYKYFEDAGKEMSQNVCVPIDLGQDGFESYIASLSKHQRQNIRTAYNKLAKNDILFRVERVHDISSELWNKCLNMYEKRSLRHWGGRNHYGHIY